MIRLHYRTILLFVIASTVQKQKKSIWKMKREKAGVLKFFIKKNIKTQNESESSQQLDTIFALAPRLKLLSV